MTKGKFWDFVRRMLMARPLLALVSSAALAGICAATSMTAEVGCTTHQCDPSTIPFSGGEGIDENNWESNGIDQPWLNFPPMATIDVTSFPPPFTGRQPYGYQVYIGTTDTPNLVVMTTAAGQLDQLSFLNGNGVMVQNGSCQQYFLRLVVQFCPLEGGGDGCTDGSAPADAAREAAPVEAGAD